MEVSASIKHFPNIKLAGDEYEQGFDENLLITKELGECFLCPVCFGVPRRPVVLKKCGHGFCEVCLTKHVIHSANLPNMDRFSTAKCPVCSTAFMKFEPVPYEKFSIPSKRAFNLIKLKCLCGVHLFVRHSIWTIINDSSAKSEQYNVRIDIATRKWSSRN